MTLRTEYDRVVADALDRAPGISPVATGLTASIDDLFLIDDRRMDALAAQARELSGEQCATGLARRIVDRIRDGHGGEMVEIWSEGYAWLTELLGPPDLRQVGGNAAQVSWALATVEAPSVLALRDRSAIQLGVLDGRIRLAGPDALATVSDSEPEGMPLKWPHGILEFTAGTLLEGLPIPRSTRVMLRFSHEPLETDDAFLAYCRETRVPVALLSGLATQPDFLTADVIWAVELATVLAARGSLVHHELSEFADPADMRAAIRVLPATSLGMSLSELTMAAGHQGNPVVLAVDLATWAHVARVVVHADEWALMVTRDESPAARDALILANALAGARARHGRPSAAPFVYEASSFTDDHPPSGPVGDGWFAITIPSPFELRPKRTVGLGDTFVAGLLLGDALERATPPTTRGAHP